MTKYILKFGALAFKSGKVKDKEVYNENDEVIGKYTGEIKSGLMNGKGTLEYSNGDKYEGEWKDSTRTGQGFYYWNNGEGYKGEWRDNYRFGKGTHLWSNNDKYIGDWNNGNRHGTGTQEWANGNKYIGEWKNDKQNGKGTYFFTNGDKYEGDWIDDKKIGKGSYIWADGGKYVGEWKDSIRTGKGVETYGNGNKYEGEFANGKYNGKGIFTWADGGKYEGDWKDGIKNGKGKYYAKGGDKYEGEYKNDLPHGKGKYTWGNGTFYEGEWKDNNYYGKGIRVYIDGSKYDGEWKDDKRNGKGILYDSQGNTLEEGEWENNECLSTPREMTIEIEDEFIGKTYTYKGTVVNKKPHGKGTMNYIENNKYEGEWKEGMRNGKGIFILKNVDGYDKYEGDWRDDEKSGKGTFIWANGDKYEGEWENNSRNGIGTKIWTNGDKYEGEWNRDFFKKGNFYKRLKENEIILYNGVFDTIVQDYSVVRYFAQGEVTLKETKINISDCLKFLKHNWGFYKGTIVYNNGNKYNGELRLIGCQTEFKGNLEQAIKLGNIGVMYDKDNNILETGLWHESICIDTKIFEFENKYNFKSAILYLETLLTDLECKEDLCEYCEKYKIELTNRIEKLKEKNEKYELQEALNNLTKGQDNNNLSTKNESKPKDDFDDFA